ncbi:hypothetical protein TNCV_4783971 [Trichonephila clavipes]|nr:hypothetical protein TNCV_4783971 [Trichonephila clavipes]
MECVCTRSRTQDLWCQQSMFLKAAPSILRGVLPYGFTFCVVDDKERPICVVCNEKVANEIMKPAKLKRHLENKRKELKNKHADFFQRRAENLKIQSVNLKKFTIPKKALRASLEVSYLIGKTLKPNTLSFLQQLR